MAKGAMHLTLPDNDQCEQQANVETKLHESGIKQLNGEFQCNQALLEYIGKAIFAIQEKGLLQTGQ